MSLSDAQQHPDPTVSEDLLTALEVIEDQPLAQRAEGYAALHDALARRLDSVAPGQHGGSA